MPGAPDDGWGSELPLHHGRPAEWPAGRRRQRRSRHGRTRNGEHAEAKRHEGRHLKPSTEHSHGGSLWTPARTVQALANLWTTVEGTVQLWMAVEAPLRCGRPTRCVSANRRIDSPVQICYQV